jgi:hypothetical protein
VVTRSLLQRGRAPAGVLHAESQQLHTGVSSVAVVTAVTPCNTDDYCLIHDGRFARQRMCRAWRCRTTENAGGFKLVPRRRLTWFRNDALRLFFRAQGGHPSVSESKCSRLSPGPPRAGFSLSRCFFRFSIRTPARTVDFIGVLYDFGSARRTRCVHIAMRIETPVIIECVRACGQILGIPLEIAFEHVPERRKLVSPGRHIARRMHNFRTHPVVPESISQASLIERIALLGPRPRPLWVRRQSGKEIDRGEAGGVARLLKR